jgi:sterol desaturase/sphingolipid hydroxylase (fatty acid hydroxylase superfamily)
MIHSILIELLWKRWDFPLLPNPHDHYQHHKKYFVNYGILVTDRIFNTTDHSLGVPYSSVTKKEDAGSKE